jgi:NTE family protein
VEAHRADGVFQGGGVKGLALAGALAEFADRQAHPGDYVDDWVQLAGTSAGAIVAAYLACGHGAQDTVKLIGETDFRQFEDWGHGGPVLGGAMNLMRHHGLAHGKAFHDWFRAQINDATFGDIAKGERTLRLIATDITRREMLVLPEDLKDYSATADGPKIDPDAFPVADAVRMSMSIPYFFQPVELYHKQSGQSTIVDGGVLSNFPVWIFDVEHDAKRPTFGFRLVGGRSAGGGLESIAKGLGWAVSMGVDMFHTASEAWDKRWVRTSTYVRTCAISAGSVGTTEFNLTAAAREELLANGKKAASDFLGAWDPAAYRNQYGHALAAVGAGTTAPAG